jgi:hypothetical protein
MSSLNVFSESARKGGIKGGGGMYLTPTTQPLSTVGSCSKVKRTQCHEIFYFRYLLRIFSYSHHFNFFRIFAYTGCEGYCRPFFKMVSCINRLSDHDKIFTVYPLLHLLISSGVHLPVRLKRPRQENQRAVIVKIIRAV